MVLQISMDEREPAAKSVAEKGLAGPVPSHDGPVLIAGEIKESVFKNEAIAETEGGVGQREERRHFRAAMKDASHYALALPRTSASINRIRRRAARVGVGRE